MPIHAHALPSFHPAQRRRLAGLGFPSIVLAILFSMIGAPSLAREGCDISC